MEWISPIKQKPNDLKMTPVAVVKKCMNLITIEDGDSILDGFKGTGNFYNNFPSNCIKNYCEIEEGLDFFKYDKEYDWFITNPAFSLITPTLHKICKEAKKGFGLLIGALNLTAKRLSIIHKSGFNITKIHYSVIKGWIGPAVFIVAERDKPSIVTYDITNHLPDGQEGLDFQLKYKQYQKNYRDSKKK